MIINIVCILLMFGCGSKSSSVVLETNSVEKKNSESTLLEHDNTQLSDDGVSNSEGDVYDKETYSYELPDEVELTFYQVELVELEEGGVKDSWEFIGQIPLGEVEGQSVVLSVYQETDANNMCSSSSHETTFEKVALLEFNGKQYRLNKCLPHYFLSNFPDPNPYVHLLPHLFVNSAGSTYLLTAVELSANIQGRMLYIFYDSINDSWLTFLGWGYPVLVDLDTSGDIELVTQFEGGGMHWPDATIYRWNNGILEGVKLKRSLDIDLNFNEVILHTEEDIPFFEIRTLTDPNNHDEAINIRYIYNDGKLIKIK